MKSALFYFGYLLVTVGLMTSVRQLQEVRKDLESLKHAMAGIDVRLSYVGKSVDDMAKSCPPQP